MNSKEAISKTMSLQMLIQGRTLSTQQRGDAQQELTNLIESLEQCEKDKLNNTRRIRVADLRELEGLHNKGEISYSKMVELLNEKFYQD